MSLKPDRLADRISGLRKDLLDYLDSRFQLLGIQLIEAGARSISQLIQRLTAFLFLLLAFVFLLTGVSLLLGEWLDSPGIGFLIMTLPFLLMSLYLWRQRSAGITARIEKSLFDSFSALFGIKKSKKVNNGE